MGFGFPAALGAKVAYPERQVLDIAGDGSFIMTSQDLACSIMEKIPVTVMVLNNSVLGMVAQWQRLFYGRRYSAVNLGNVPDFVKLAEAYGLPGYRVDKLDDVIPTMRKAQDHDGPVLIEFRVEEHDMVYPMVPAGADLDAMIRRPHPRFEDMEI